jgi:alkylation response protein AidB-like acyl-CoA dehydrogenase
MTGYRAPLRDLLFVLEDVLDIGQYRDLPRFDQADREVTEAILTEAARFCEEVAQPLNRIGDREGCSYADGQVTVPPGFADAYRQYSEAGWLSLSADPDHGGQGLPEFLSIALVEMMNAANAGFYMYPGLIPPACRALAAGGSDELKSTYLSKMIAGTWSATMNLTEPQCGTDLGLIRTRATPNADGSHSITGRKIWITSGEHEMTENIVHLVLARVDGAPDGVRGISLFVVPKFIPGADGRPGRRNALRCDGIEHKMGLHGSATCEMTYEGATGWLVGAPHQGLRSMFVMMNEARLACGVQGLGLAEAAYQQARAFAVERLQGRAPGGPANPDQAADPIIAHPDVRRLLLDQKSFNEAARAFALWLALQSDLERVAETEPERQRAADYMALLTPVAKAYLTDKCFDGVSKALQVHGGAGYTEDMGVAQIMRDARITQIYEGTNGIQALDLVGRKIWMADMRALNAFVEETRTLIAACEETAGLDDFADALAWVCDTLEDATTILRGHGPDNPVELGAASTDYLHLLGLTCLTHMWARMGRAAVRMSAGDDDRSFLDTKLRTGRYFLARWVPEAQTHLARIRNGGSVVMALAPDEF